MEYNTVDELRPVAMQAMEDVNAACNHYYRVCSYEAAGDYLMKASRAYSLLEIYSDFEPDNESIDFLVDYYLDFLMNALQRVRVAHANP